MPRVLITYASMAGSTAEVAERIAKTFSEASDDVILKAVNEVSSLDQIDAVVVCAPMIIGWHRDARRFLGRFAPELAQKPVALCMTCYELTTTGAQTVQGVPVTVDPNLGEPPKAAGKLSFKEKQTTVEAYVRGALQKAPGVQPVSIGIFKGAVNFGKLSLFPMLFVRLLIRARPGDYRNWDAITAWAAGVRAKFNAAQ